MRFFKFKRPLSPSRLSLASFMLSAFLRAGITTLDAVSAAAGSLRGRAARAFASAAHDIGAGRSLSDSLMRTGAFPEIFIESVRAGEESGRLARVMYSLGSHYAKRSRALGAVHAAMLYPALLLALSFIVVIIVMTQLMPSVISLLEAAGAPLPPSTRVLVGIYDLVIAHWQCFFLNQWAMQCFFSIFTSLSARLCKRTDRKATSYVSPARAHCPHRPPIDLHRPQYIALYNNSSFLYRYGSSVII